MKSGNAMMNCMRRKRFLTMLRPGWLGLAACAMCLAGANTSRAQTLLIKPSCGTPGSSVAITGSGWAEPEPLCRYVFTFDGASLAPDQQDGLFGPPNATGTVPGGAAPGKHTIKTDLRLNNPDSEVQCRQRNFCVVAMAADPWNGGGNVTTNVAGQGTGSINIIFNPKNVCSITDCTQIVPIQVIQHTGHIIGTPAGTFQNLTFAQQGFSGTRDHQADKTAAGWVIDYVNPTSDPFYPYANAQGNHFGMQDCAMPVTAGHFDNPGRPLFPSNVDQIVLNFEVDYFCEEGENRGEYLGQFFWTWTKNSVPAANQMGAPPNLVIEQNRTGTAANMAPTQPPPGGPGPTGAFMAALTMFANNHGFPIPIGVPNNQTGEACK
jgi:hypothetical protein